MAASLLLFPVLFLIHRSHRIYVNRLEDEKRHAEEQRAHAMELAALHRRTIETLALAIEAKDQTTADHLQRVEIYAIGVGKELGLSEIELEALRAAALLHDIGKLAVPEYIITKPGKLTPEEFEKMKTHTVVGAELVEQIRFPYPVAPMVRGHHEKWNGLGYPDGLAGENIPIGARILAAVDCLDALASDRQYRRALPLSEAIRIVIGEAGKSYDPRIVEVLARRYVDLEHLATSGGAVARAKLSVDLKIERGDAPAAGFETTNSLLSFNNSLLAEEFALSIDSAKDRDQVLSILSRALFKAMPYDAMILYVKHEERLIPELFKGDNFARFASVEIPVGAGLSGWVAENRKSIVNGNPSVETGYQTDPEAFRALQSALAVPLDANGGFSGVLSLYRKEQNAFSAGNQEVLIMVGRNLSTAMQRTASVLTP